MKLIKKVFTRNIGGKEKKLPSYYLVTDEGRKLMIKPVFSNDWQVLDFLSEYVPNESNSKTN